jgi:hypothetical protein
MRSTAAKSSGTRKAQDPEDLDEDEPFYADKLIGFNGAYAVNHPVQGSSAEVMMIALTRLDRALRNEPVRLIANADLPQSACSLVRDFCGRTHPASGPSDRRLRRR